MPRAFLIRLFNVFILWEYIARCDLEDILSKKILINFFRKALIKIAENKRMAIRNIFTAIGEIKLGSIMKKY